MATNQHTYEPIDNNFAFKPNHATSDVDTYERKENGFEFKRNSHKTPMDTYQRCENGFEFKRSSPKVVKRAGGGSVMSAPAPSVAPMNSSRNTSNIPNQ